VTIRYKNFSNVDPTQLPAETHFVKCNFFQRVPTKQGQTRRGVRLWPDDGTPRVFEDCNMANCEPPPGSTYISCNSYITEFDIFAFTDDVVIDDVVVHSEEKHDQVTYGRYDTETESYEYYPTPITEPQDH
jgi:hypothetical protein